MTVHQIIEQETGEQVTNDTILDDLGLDSLEYLSLMLAIQNENGCHFSDAMIAKMNTVGAIVREVEKC